jgi:NADH-quinone oxidoreductase subunit C
MEFREHITQSLRRLPAEVLEVDYRQRGYHLEVLVDAADLRPLAGFLLEQGFYLVFLSGLHVRPAIEVTYQFAHHEFPCRLVGRASVQPDNTLPTIADIFQGADWHEREVRDFFGVVFAGHPNLQPLLLPEDTPDLKPLLKKEAALKDAAEVRWPQERPEGDPAPPTIRQQPGNAAS